MKNSKKTYNLKEIYNKLISDEIPQSYVDFVVSHCAAHFVTEEEMQKQANASFATIYPKLYNRL